MSMLYKIGGSLALVLLLQACHSIPAIERPDIEFAQQWQAAASQDEQSAVDPLWWRQFSSPQLDRLVDDALENSPDLRVAAQRVIQAELQMNNAGSSLFPSLSASASTGASEARSSGVDWRRSDSSRVSLGASYEVDLWGRVSATMASAEAGFQAQQYDYEASRLSLVSGVASAWFQWLTLQQRLHTAQENLRIAERIQQLVDVRYRNGVATAADISRQKISVLNQQATLEPLALQERQTRAALAVLSGHEPYPFTLDDSETLLALTLPEQTVSVPSSVLTRRPDLAALEAQLQAADADVAAARAALFPALQLSLSAGRSSADLLSLSGGSDSVGITASLAQTLFDRGRLRNQVRISESQRIALLEQYRKAIYTALQEVDDALDRIQVYAVQEQQQQHILDETERTLRLTEVRYREGSDDLTTLLDAQRSFFQAQDQLVQQRQSRLDAIVDLYKALGGGWQQ